MTPSEKWDIQPEVAATFYRRLGNTVLLRAADNVRVANTSFSEKRPIYKENLFALTKVVASYETWGTDEIEEQQSKMAELAPTRLAGLESPGLAFLPLSPSPITCWIRSNAFWFSSRSSGLGCFGFGTSFGTNASITHRGRTLPARSVAKLDHYREE